MLVLIGMLIATPITSRTSYAFCCKCCVCWSSTVFTDLAGWIQDWLDINIHFFIQLYLHRIMFWDYQFWTLYMVPLLAMMSEQLGAVAMQQMQIVGAFLDAKEQLEAQRDLQRLMARAHKDYHPSMELCEFSSRVKSLALSERKGELSTLSLSQRSIDRMLGHKSSIGLLGREGGIAMRLKQFREKYCDRSDNGNSLVDVCTGPLATATQAQLDKYNKDVDFPRTLAKPMTVNNLDFTNTTLSDSEEDLLALGANLYGFSGSQGIDPKVIANKPSGKINPSQQAYLDLRAYVAKQNVAENSFNSLIAMKSDGTAGSKTFLVSYLRELGVEPAEFDALLGANPSYHAQMEVLTKLAYQHPSFYTALYDKPANVERKGVAIQAIGLIQKFDLLKSYLRTESSLSVLLELSVMNMQREIEDSIGKLDVSVGKRL